MLELQGKDPTPGCLATMPGPQEQKGQGSQQGPEEGLTARGGDSLTSASSSVLSCPKQNAPHGAGWLKSQEGDQECSPGDVQPGLCCALLGLGLRAGCPESRGRLCALHTC